MTKPEEDEPMSTDEWNAEWKRVLSFEHFQKMAKEHEEMVEKVYGEFRDEDGELQFDIEFADE